MKTAEYLTALAKLTETGSDYAIAKLLNVSDSTVSRYRAGHHHPDVPVQATIATLLQMPLDKVAADIELERATTDHARDFWRKRLKTIGQRAAAALLAIAATLTFPTGEKKAEGTIAPSAYGDLQQKNTNNRTINYTQLMQRMARCVLGTRPRRRCIAPRFSRSD